MLVLFSILSSESFRCSHYELQRSEDIDHSRGMAHKKCPRCLKWGANRYTCKASSTTKTDVAPENVELRKVKERADMTKKTARGSDGDHENEKLAKLAFQVQLEAG